jgi:sigma-B regulation protein RsbU (phosphoserine phosphatase)
MQTSDDGTFVRVNAMFCQWVGYPPDALVGRKRLQDLLTMGGRIFHQTHWEPLLQIQGSVSEVKLELLHSNGTAIPMVLNAVRRKDGGRTIHEIAAYVARDRDKYERELVAARRRLEDLVAERTRLLSDAKDRAVIAEQMIGIVSHDLRNPLSNIGLAAAVLGTQELSETQRRTLAAITRATERANLLVADLLDFTQARLGNGLPALRVEIDLHQCVALAVEELALSHPGRKLEHFRSGEPQCSADANRLAQMIGNLVSNAFAYGHPEAPVTVRSSVEANQCSIAVHNHGAPVPKEAQGALFEPMTRGRGAERAAKTSQGRSVGLGLYIVREIARSHGGDVQVRSTMEEGTTFLATFPRW